jgi:DNA-binding transcriptional LysR family regulator
MKVQIDDWSDLRFVLAVGQEGTLAGAARRLGVTHPTVFRRLRDMEARLETTLFERQRRGYVPTVSGAAVIEVAEGISEDILTLERRIGGHNIRLSGVLRLTTVETLIRDVLCHTLQRFSQTHPNIQLELVISNQLASLSKRETDMAIRIATEVPEQLEGERLSNVAHAVYAAAGYLEKKSRQDLGQCSWLMLEESFGHTPFNPWIRKTYPEAPIALRSNTVLTLFEATRSGFGLSILPYFLADPEPGLVRLTDPIDELTAGLWLLVHPELINAARVHAFKAFFLPEMADIRPLLEGERPTS